MDVADRLYGLRKQYGMSQEELAGRLGVTRQAVQKWEAGTSRPDMDNLTALARQFHVTLDWLVTGEEPERGEAPRTVIVENHYHYEGWHYEYKSRRTIWGRPLVHINLAQHGFRRANGIIAIGNVATGVVSAGVVSAGLISLGCVSAGGLAVACLSVGLMSLGCISVGLAAAGGIAVGWLAFGGVARGVYAVGGVASAARIAIGPEAHGPVTFPGDSLISREALLQAIGQAAPEAPLWLRKLLSFFA